MVSSILSCFPEALRRYFVDQSQNRTGIKKTIKTIVVTNTVAKNRPSRRTRTRWPFLWHTPFIVLLFVANLPAEHISSQSAFSTCPWKLKSYTKHTFIREGSRTATVLQKQLPKSRRSTRQCSMNHLLTNTTYSWKWRIWNLCERVKSFSKCWRGLSIC